MKKRLVLVLFIAVCVIGSLFATGQKEAPKAAAVEKAKKQYTIGLVMKSLSNPAIKAISDAAERKAAEMGVKLIVLSSQGFSALEEQIKQVEDLIQKKVDLIGIQCVDSKGVIPVINEAEKKGIPIITVDTGSDGGKVVTYIATDNYAAGKQAAAWMIETLEGKGKVAMIEGTPGSMQGRQRKDGFHEVLATAKGIKLVTSIPANFERAKGMQVMEDIITANPDLAGVFCANDEMAMGASEALRQRNLTGKVALLGMNGANDAMMAVWEGKLTGTVVQYSSTHGDEFVRVAVQYLDGRKDWPAYMPLPTFVADKKLLFRLTEAFNVAPTLKK
jgi:ribose transport system substrate-binding protein